MARQTYQDQLQIMRAKMLSPEEIFLLGYLKSFNRKKTQTWKEDKLFDFSEKE